MKDSKTVVGIDIAKRVFQLHWIDLETGEIVSLQLKREKFLEHFANRSSCRIGMEACGGAQHWARKLTAMGHQVKLLSGKAVKGFVMGNKNDRHDARAIWTAGQQPHVKGVAIKTEEQQAIADALARLADRLPAMVIDTLRDQWARIEKMDSEIATIEQRIKLWLREDDACKRIAEIPGVGPLTATAAVAIIGDARVFRSGREFAAFAGLVPRQTGTGGSGQAARDQQARGHLPANAADPRRQVGVDPCPGSWPVGNGITPAPTAQRRGRGAGQQDGTDDLGDARP